MYLGLDLGTSGLKGVVVNENGQIIAHHSASLCVQRPFAGWSEQNPSDWIDAAKQVLCVLKPFAGKIASIGLSGQMHGATCLDDQGGVIRPCILWNDTRAHKEAEELDDAINLKSIFGNITFAGFTSPKILWMKAHEPENYRKISKILLPKDYLRYWLSGDFLSDMSDASGTGWLDISKRKWSDELLEASGLTQNNMPHLVEGSEISTSLRDDIADEYGFVSNIPIVGGAGDNASTAIGLDIVNAGKAFLSLGTSGVVFAVNKQFSPDPQSALHAFAHCVPDTWHQMGVTLSATESLNWLSRQFGEESARVVKKLQALNAPTNELFLPFLGGERTPYNSTHLRASFHNISHETDQNALVRAVLEGVSFSLKECFDLMEKSGGKIETILAVGGGAQSDYWLELLATILDRPIVRPKGAEHAAAIGAARLAAMGIGGDFAINNSPHIFYPSVHKARYSEKYQIYKSMITKILG